MLKGKETANTSWAIEIAIPALLLGFTWGKVDILAGVAILMAASVLINELVQDVIYAKTLEQIMQRTEEHKDI